MGIIQPKEELSFGKGKLIVRTQDREESDSTTLIESSYIGGRAKINLPCHVFVRIWIWKTQVNPSD
jgi:hypothetical protein